MQTVTPYTIIHTLTKCIKQSLLFLHLRVCVCMIEPVSAGVCQVTWSAQRCLSLSTEDRHAGPPGGKMGLQLCVPLRRAEPQASDFAVTCFHQLHTCCLPLCYAKVFDLAKQPGRKYDDDREIFGMVSLSFQYLVTREM